MTHVFFSNSILILEIASTSGYMWSIWLLDEFETTVKSQFKITLKSDVDLYLGIHFDYLPNGDVKITQPKLLQGCWKNTRMS